MNRRWFKIHLSTAVLLMITTGALMWKNISPEPQPRPGSTSEWISSNGLGIRISIKNSVVTAESPAEFIIELRNDSQSPIIVFADSNLWEHVLIETPDGKEAPYISTAMVSPAIPSIDWFVVLKPEETVKHFKMLPLDLSRGLPVLRENAADQVVGAGTFHVKARYFMGGMEQVRDKTLAWVDTEKALGGKLWEGSIFSRAIPIFVHPPWSWNLNITQVAIAVAILLSIAISSEWLIRRREAHKP